MTAEEFLKSKGLFNDKSIRLSNMGMTTSEAMVEFAKEYSDIQNKQLIDILHRVSDCRIMTEMSNPHPIKEEILEIIHGKNR